MDEETDYSRRLRVLLVDDQPLFLELTAEALRRRGILVAACESFDKAVAVTQRAGFDVGCIDVRLGEGKNGFDLARELRRERPGAPIMFLTTVADPAYFGLGLSDALLDDCSYLLKPTIRDIDQLVDGLYNTYSGRMVIDRDIMGLVRGNTLGLTPHQLKLLRSAAQGKTNSAIADELNVTSSAIEAGFTRIARTLGVEASRNYNLRVACVAEYLRRALYS